MIRPKQPLSVLFVSDISDSQLNNKQAWLLNQIKLLVSERKAVTVLGRDIASSNFSEAVIRIGAKYIAPHSEGTTNEDSTGVLPRFRARQALNLMKNSEFDLIIAQGFELCAFLSAEKIIQTKLWSWIDDNPSSPIPLDHNKLNSLTKIAQGSRLLITSNELVRSQVDSHCAIATGKTRKIDSYPVINESAINFSTGSAAVFIDAKDIVTNANRLSALTLTEEACNQRSVPRVVVSNTDDIDETALKNALTKSSLDAYPGLSLFPYSFWSSPWITKDSLVLVDLTKNDQPSLYFTSVVHQTGLRTTDLFTAIASLTTLTDSVRLTPDPIAEEFNFSELSIVAQLSSDLSFEEAVPIRDRKTNVLLAGADFKFAGDLVHTLSQRKDINLKVDLFKNNAHPQPEQSSQLLYWADVVLAEFASKNAIWYSQNLLPHQTLIVHLHGYELLSEWISDLDIHKVTKVVFASEFYRQKALEMMDWPEHKLVVIPNSVHSGDLARPKYSDAAFHIGIAGIVPILKRPDRALDLLEKLREHDERFTLHVKGHSPWNYSWEWKKPVHQDAYRDFYERIGRNPLLAEGIAFEPFSPDVANWLRKIGWILSPSTRETFHLAAIEGASSGSIPIAWEREGSIEIIGEKFNVRSVDEAANFIIDATSSMTKYDALSKAAITQASRYEIGKILPMWLSLILKNTGQSTSLTLQDPPSQPELWLENKVLEELNYGNTDGALSILDENIKVTAGKTGSIKDLELYVRGMAAIDEKRFTHFMPSRSITPRATAPVSFLTVRVLGNSNHSLSLAGLEDKVVDILPPKYFLSSSTMSHTWDIQQDRSSFSIGSDQDLRLDRWSEYVKAVLQNHILDNQITHIVASGPTWLAYPVARAADALNTHFIWHIDDSEILQAATEGKNKASDDMFAQTTHATFNRAETRIVTNPELITQKTRYWDIDALITRNQESKSIAQISNYNPAAALPYLSNTSSPSQEDATIAPSYRLKNLRVAAIGSPSFISNLRNEVNEVIEIPIQNYFKSLDADLSALLIDASGDEEGAWKGRIRYANKEGRIPTTKILDFARSLGVPTAFIYRNQELVSPLFLATARKADSLVTCWPEALPPVLSLNPSSNHTGSLWNPSLTFKSNLTLLLRNMGVNIDEDVRFPTIPQAWEETANHRDLDSGQSAILESEDLSKEKISIVLATHNGRNRILQMLNSISAQTLPHRLIEVIVIENGKQDGTENIVTDFAEKNLEFNTKYFYESKASAGNARNIGIKEATGKYITFVDDDDILERNYLLSMWLTAAEDAVVIGYLCDQHHEGDINFSTPNNNRIASLNDSRMPLSRRAGLLGLNACKLIPTSYIKTLRYDEKLKSGEDTVFMANLLRFNNLVVVGAAPMDKNMYIRVLREDSISRRPQSFDFSVVERVSVINLLHELLPDVPKGCHAAVKYLADSQASFIRTYISQHPAEADLVKEYVENNINNATKVRLA